MRYGFVYPGDDAGAAVELAQEADAAGWDGFFVWDAVWCTDPWVMLGAMAVTTQSIRLRTWWIEAMWGTTETDKIRERLLKGPPRVA